MVKGFSQQKGININEIFSPVVKMKIICLVLGKVLAWDLELENLDVKTIFLHGDIQEELHMEQSKGFIK